MILSRMPANEREHPRTTIPVNTLKLRRFWVTANVCERCSGRPGGPRHNPKNQRLGLANRQFSAIDFTGKNGGRVNRLK